MKALNKLIVLFLFPALANAQISGSQMPSGNRLNVEEYGIKTGNTASQNTSAMNVLCASIAAQTNGGVYKIKFGSGEYDFNDPIVFQNCKAEVEGDGVFSTRLNFSDAEAYFSVNPTYPGSSYTYYFRLSKLTIVGDNSGTGVVLKNIRDVIIDDVSIADVATGIKVDFSYQVAIRNSYISGFSIAGISFDPYTSSNTTNYVDGCHIEGSGDGIRVSNSTVVVENTLIQSCSHGIYLPDVTGAADIICDRVHFEGNILECIHNARTFKAAQGNSVIRVVNSNMLKSGSTTATSAVFSRFNTTYISLCNMSYDNAYIKRVVADDGQFYKVDEVKRMLYENPIKSILEY